VTECLQKTAFGGVGPAAIGLVADVVLDLVPHVGHHRADLHLAAGAAEIVVNAREILLA
jgi:hypothetical protein